MRGVTEGGIVDVEVIEDGAHHHFAGVEADTDPQRAHWQRAKHVGAAPHLFLHRQSGVAGAHGVVLMGQRRAEQRHDAITQNLIDDPAVAPHRIHHNAQDRIEMFAHLLRIELLDETCRVANIREQNRDPFTFAGQMVRWREHGAGLITKRYRSAQVRVFADALRKVKAIAVFFAKLGAVTIAFAAASAVRVERRTALVAKLRVESIAGLALRAN